MQAARAVPDTPFTGLPDARRRQLLLTLWIIAVTAYLAVFTTDVWLSYGMLAVPCSGESCHYQALTLAEASALTAWGLPLQAYAVYVLGISAAAVLFFTALAVLMLKRLYPQPRAFLYSLMLIVMPVTAITSFDIVAEAFPFLSIAIQLLAASGMFLLISFLLLFPRSRFQPRWTLILPLIGVFVMLTALFYPALNEWLPLNQPILVALLLIITMIVYRYRRLFDDTERRQTKWVVLGMIIFILGVPIWTYTYEIAAPTAGQARLLTLLLGWTACNVVILALPSAIFIAIVRDNLLDIDLIIRRTLVYALLTAILTGVYYGAVLFMRTMLNTTTGRQEPLAIFAATLLVAALFQPLRQRLQRGVNRFFFGERDEPYAVLSRLGQRLQESGVPGETLPTITGMICQTLKLPHAAIIVQAPNGARSTVAASGQASWPSLEWPLRYQGQIVGWLAVAPRSPDEPFADQERRLLEDIASHAGAAAYTMQLTAALQRSREQLILTREEERRRIRRDLHDEMGPTLASQTFALDAILEMLETDTAEAARLLRRLKAQNQSMVAEIRRLVYELRPPALDELGLAAALQMQASQMNGHTALQITVSAQPDPLPPLPAAVEVAAYRIALEAMTNVVRHAKAQRCDVLLQLREQNHSLLDITVRDDGIGPSQGAATGVGLRSMRERAEELGGDCTLENREAGGARLHAMLPISDFFTGQTINHNGVTCHTIGGNMPIPRVSLLKLQQLFRAHGPEFPAMLQREHGDLFMTRVPTLPPVVFVLHPKQVTAVLSEQQPPLEKPGAMQRVLRASFGNGLFNSSGDFWRRQRTLMQPAFQHSNVVHYAERMVSHTEAMVARWQDGQVVSIAKEMHDLTFAIVLDALFSTAVDGAEREKIHRAIRDLGQGLAAMSRSTILFLLPQATPLPPLRRKRRGEKALAQSVQHLITQREALGEEDGPQDLLTTLLFARDPQTGAHMSHQQLQDELITLYIAGHDTTAVLLSWTWVLLAQHPVVAAQLHEELDGVLAGQAPTAADLPRLPLVQAIVKETLRLYPPAWFLFRQAAGDMRLDGAPLDDGSILFAMPYTTQRDARWFAEPDAFQPQRWLDGMEKSLPRGAYFPFGMGPRTCIGSGFAMMEAQLLLATVARRFHLEQVDEARLGHTATLGFAEPVGMRLHKRASSGGKG